MIRKVTLALVASLVSMTLLAQTGGVKGTVLNRVDRTPVTNAELTLFQGAQEIATAKTDESGNFLIERLEDGIYDLVVKASEFLETRVNVTVNDGYVKNMFNITLTQSRSEIMDEIFEEFDMDDSGYNDNPVILFDQNDVFNSVAGYNFSSVRFNPRGYSSESQDVLLAGVKMNDAITGYSPFSLWSGLNEATRTKYTVTGSEVSDYGLGGYNGLTNIPANASNVRKGLRGSVLTNSALYRLRLMMTYSSGMNDKGWAYAVSASARLGGNDWIDGVYYRSFGYYASVEKKFNDVHRLAATFMATPGSRGAQNASTQEVYDLMGDNMYNSNWGYQNGKIRNSRIRKTHEPIAILKYDYTPNDKFKASATLLYRFGKNGYTAIDWYDAQDPRPDYYRNLPSYFWMENRDFGRRNMFKYAAAKEAWTHSSLYPEMTHVNWERLYDVNRNNLEGVAGIPRSKYISEERRVDQRDLNFAGSFKWNTNSWLTLSGGLNAKINRTENYKIVDDLLGGYYFVDIDSFAEREYASAAAKVQNDLDYYLAHGEARRLYKGDKFGYDYYAQIRNIEAWLNGRFAVGNFSADLGGKIGYSSFWREGLVRKGLFPGLKPDGTDYIIDGVNLSRDSEGNLLPTSYGKSEVKGFLTYAGKLGLNYMIGGRMRIYGNVGFFNDAPNFNMAFMSPRTRNTTVDNLTTTKTFTSDLNWQFTGNGFNARITGYYTYIWDQTDVMSAFDDMQNAFSNFALSGIDERHYGIEVGFKVPTPVPNLSIQGVVSAGRYEYTSNPTMVQTIDNSAEPVEYGGFTTLLIPFWKSTPIFKRDGSGNPTYEIDHYQRHYIPSTPQLATSLGLSYNYNYWYIDGDVEYFDGAYLDMNPLYRTDYATGGPDGIVTPTEVEYMTTQEKFDAAWLVNFSIGKSWYIQRKYQLGFSLNAKNILNNKNVKTGGYEQTRIVDNTVGNERYYRFDPKYFYMSGVNYMLNVYFRF
ncbi:MAG: carboxypeptidase regulatory-like domain-containing protein [Bacteroidales bacterium]|nr:carboxypeptidase regulatory-like domain-containing protein [Bacteroidales bacterium]